MVTKLSSLLVYCLFCEATDTIVAKEAIVKPQNGQYLYVRCPKCGDYVINKTTAEELIGELAIDINATRHLQLPIPELSSERIVLIDSQSSSGIGIDLKHVGRKAVKTVTTKNGQPEFKSI